jgi:hypothetical protein
MTEEQTVKLYAASFMARREEANGHTTLRIRPGIVLGSSEEEAHREGMGGAFAALPESEGWTDHQVILTELPNSLELGEYLVTLRADKRRP